MRVDAARIIRGGERQGRGCAEGVKQRGVVAEEGAVGEGPLDLVCESGLIESRSRERRATRHIREGEIRLRLRIDGQISRRSPRTAKRIHPRERHRVGDGLTRCVDPAVLRCGFR